MFGFCERYTFALTHVEEGFGQIMNIWVTLWIDDLNIAEVDIELLQGGLNRCAFAKQNWLRNMLFNYGARGLQNALVISLRKNNAHKARTSPVINAIQSSTSWINSTLKFIS